MYDRERYLTKDEYVNMGIRYKDDIKDNFNSYIGSANIEFDRLTDDKYLILGVDEEPKYVRYKIKTAMCLLLDHVYTEDKNETRLKTFKVGESSQTVFSPGELGTGGSTLGQVESILASIGASRSSRVYVR